MSVLSNLDRKYYQCIPKRGSCSISKQRYTYVIALGSYKGEGTRVGRHDRITFFFQTCFFSFILKILLATPLPLQTLHSISYWATLPLAVKIYCLTRYSLVFMLNGSQQSYRYIAQFGIFWMKPSWLDVYKRHLSIFYSFNINSFFPFHYAPVRDRGW